MHGEYNDIYIYIYICIYIYTYIYIYMYIYIYDGSPTFPVSSLEATSTRVHFPRSLGWDLPDLKADPAGDFTENRMTQPLAGYPMGYSMI